MQPGPDAASGAERCRDGQMRFQVVRRNGTTGQQQQPTCQPEGPPQPAAAQEKQPDNNEPTSKEEMDSNAQRLVQGCCQPGTGSAQIIAGGTGGIVAHQTQRDEQSETSSTEAAR